MRKQLKALDAVTDCNVDYDKKIATVTVKKGTDPETVAKALDSPFTGTVKS